MEEMVESWAVHRFHVAVLITPGKALLTDYSVHWIQLRNIGIVHVLTILNRNILNESGVKVKDMNRILSK